VVGFLDDRAGDQDALQSDPGTPPPLEQLAHGFARDVGEQHVQHEEQGPDELRDLVGALGAGLLAGVIRPDVERRHHAEDDSQDVADQHGEEVVDARSAAAQPVDALQPERKRRQHRDERQQVEILLERRVAAVHRNQAALEADAVREDERPGREQRVREDVQADQQPIVPLHHRAPTGAAVVSSMTAFIC
jgi:hypothetical protein